MTMLGPLQSDIEAINSVKDKYRKERDYSNHFSTLSEGVPAVGWVTVVRDQNRWQPAVCTESSLPLRFF